MLVCVLYATNDILLGISRKGDICSVFIKSLNVLLGEPLFCCKNDFPPTLIKLHGLILWLSRRYSFIAKHLDSKRFDRKKLKLLFNYITTCQHCDRCLCQSRIVRRDGKYFWVQDGIYRSFRVSRDLINDAL